MADYAHKKTDQEIKAIERRLRKEYKQAAREVKEKTDRFFERFKEKDEDYKRKVDSGEKTKKQYREWRSNQIATGVRWEQMKNTIAQDYANVNKTARAIVRGKAPDVYALNYNFGTYQTEKAAKLNTSFTLYDRNTVAYLMRNNPQLLPNPGKSTNDRILNGLDVRWNRQQIQSVMMQGIIQGESIPKIARRLAEEVGDKNYKSAVRNARTAMTSAQNAGRMDSYRRAEKMGIELNKRWLATHDGRTRHWHSELDEVSVPLEEPFVNDYGEIMYPGDPGADPANVYNCRCTLCSDIKGIKTLGTRLKEYKGIDKMSFNAWKNDRQKATEKERGISHKTEYGDNAIDIDEDYINSNEYRKKFRGITDNPQVDDKIADYARQILRERTGTFKETLYVMDANTGKVITAVRGEKDNQISYTSEQLKRIKEAKQENKTLVAIHNHPTGYPPTIDDGASAKERGYDIGVVVGHNGTVETYGKTSKKYTEIECDKIHEVVYLQSAYETDSKERFKKWKEVLSKNGMEIEWRG